MEEERPESDIRKRAAWLLAMLAVVAGLLVLLSLTLFKTSGSGGTDNGDVDDLPTDVTASAPASAPRSPVSSPGSGSSSTGARSSGASSSGSSGPVPKPSCPGQQTCAVKGDVSGAMSAINSYRTKHGMTAVPTTSSAAAERCALTDGATCPSSFVWVRVEDLSGSGVVDGVTRFRSNDDLLDNNAKSFEVGWAYNPGSKSLSCALIRND